MSVQKIICLMNKYKYKGYVYLVSRWGVDYAVKNNHLDEFVSLFRGDGAIVICDFVFSHIDFDNALQWYKKI